MRTMGMGLVLLFVTAALAALAAGRQDGNSLAALDYFVGTWKSEMKNPAGEGTMAQTFEYWWALDRKFMLGRALTRAGQMTLTAETVLGWEAAKNEIACWSFSSDGSVVITRSDPPADGRMRFTGELFGGFGSGPARFNFLMKNPESYDLIVEVLRDGEWKPRGQVSFTRGAGSTEGEATPLFPPHAAMAGLAPLVGRWQQSGESPQGAYRVVYSFAPVMAGHFVRTEMHIAQGSGEPALHALSYIGWHAGKQRLVQFGFSPDMGALEGEVTAEGGEAVVAMQIPGRPPMRIRYRRTDAGLETVVELQRDGAFAQMSRSTMSPAP
jgi:hypothetical protein